MYEQYIVAGFAGNLFFNSWVEKVGEQPER